MCIRDSLTTDAQGAFPGGDSFSVYPGADGTPLESIRLKVFHHALQDHRALNLLEELGGRELVEQTVEPVSYTHLLFEPAANYCCQTAACSRNRQSL